MAITTTAAVTTAKELNRVGQSPVSAKPRLESIDGLRGLACLGVLLGHSWVHFGRSAWPKLNIGSFHISLLHPLAYGYGGVDLFFVLSGFCLAYPVLSKSEQSVNWRQYFVHRVRRIIPPYWAALLMFGILSLLMRHSHWEQIHRVLPWPGLRQLAYTIPLVSTSFNSSFWTLPVEWRWYFLFPLLIMLCRRVRGPGVLIVTAIISLFSMFFFFPTHLLRIQFLVTILPTFLPLFALGIWAAEIRTQPLTAQTTQRLLNYVNWGVLAGVLLIAGFAPLWQINPGSSDALPRLLTWGPFCFFLVLAATQEGSVRRFTSWRPLVLVGTFSYSLYLVHEPFLRAAAALVLPLHWAPGLQLVFSEVLLPAVLVGFAYLFFLVAEKPFLRRPVKKAIEQEVASATA